eukprot:4285289-Alexandrium_andersonii.AAC.1
MNPAVRKVLEGNRLLSLREVLKKSGYGDPDLAVDIVAGFKLTGTACASAVFPAKDPADVEEAHSDEWLWEQAATIRSE